MQLARTYAATQGTIWWRLTDPLRTLSRRYPGLSAPVKMVLEALYWAVRLQFIRGMRLRKATRVLADSGLVDLDFYVARHPEVAVAGDDPVTHYLLHGASDGGDPNAWFSTTYYLGQNPDVAAAGVNPLVHYVLHGAKEGRQPGPDFDGEAYLRRYPDVARSGLNPLSHFLLFGRDEGRVPGELPERESAPESIAPAHPSEVAACVKHLRRVDDRRTSILIVDRSLPTPDQDSGSVRMLAMVKLFVQLGYNVSFVSDNELEQPEYEENLTAAGARVMYGFSATQADLDVHGLSYRFVLLSRPAVAERYMCLVRAKAILADVVYDTVDLHWLRFHRAAEMLGDAQLVEAAEEHRRLEEFAIRSADMVLAISQSEKEKTLAEWPGAPVEVLPNIHQCRPLPKDWSNRKDLLFIGGYEHQPNVDAVMWFVTEVLPLIATQLPDVRFKIVGSKPPDSFRILVSGSVELVGYVRDPDPYFDDARVFVAPLRYGAGMKGKIGQAMSLGLPVVTTSIGAEGMLLSDGAHALIADSAREFAAAVVRLYRDKSLWYALRERALSHIEGNFSEKPVAAHLQGSLSGQRRELGRKAMTRMARNRVFVAGSNRLPHLYWDCGTWRQRAVGVEWGVRWG